MNPLDEVIVGLDWLFWEKNVEDTKGILSDASAYLKKYQKEKMIWDEIQRYHPEIKELLKKYENLR